MTLTIDGLLTLARARLARLSPAEALRATRRGDLLVDIRSEDQVRAGGAIPGAVWVSRNVLEWRAAVGSPHADPRLAACAGRLIVICQQGYQSSLAAAVLQDLGRAGATDVEGGFEAWLGEGLPVDRAVDPTRP